MLNVYWSGPGGIVTLSGILGFWRRSRSALQRRIDNLGCVQGAELALKSVNVTMPCNMSHLTWYKISARAPLERVPIPGLRASSYLSLQGMQIL